jgi:hypothetical protein
MREFESKYLRLTSSPSSCHLNPCPRELPLPTFERHGTESKYLRLTSSPSSCYPSLCAFDLPYRPLRHRHCRPSRTYPKQKLSKKKKRLPESHLYLTRSSQTENSTPPHGSYPSGHPYASPAASRSPASSSFTSFSASPYTFETTIFATPGARVVPCRPRP